MTGSWKLISPLVAILMIATASFVYAADSLVIDGDGLTPIADHALDFGQLCPSGSATPTNDNIVLALKASVSASGKWFDDSATVTVTATGVAGVVSATNPAGTIALPSNWVSLSNNLSNSVSNKVSLLNAGTSNGTQTATVTYTASGSGFERAGSPPVTSGPQAISITGNLTVRWQVLAANNPACVTPTDTTPPVITPTVTGTLGNNGWYTSNVTVSWTVVDNESAIASSTGCGTTVISADTAGQLLTCSATSSGGSASESVTIKRDATAPTATVNIVGSPNGNGWFNSAVSFSVTCNDATSGEDVSLRVTPGNYSTPDGTGVVSGNGSCTDMAGNASASDQSDAFNYDATAPTATVNIVGSPNGNGWFNSAVSFSVTCTDATSLEDVSLTVTPSAYSTPDGTGVVSGNGSCTDLAGNASVNDQSDAFNYDATNPLVSLVGGPANGGSYYFGSVPAAPTCTASDATSGLAGPCQVTGYGTTVGPHTVTASATDNADNTNSDSATYDVLAWTLYGFYQPVDMRTEINPGVWNTVKGGSTVPFKFEIFAGSTELTDVSAVDTFSVVAVTCPNNTLNTDAIEFTTTGGTSLRYDATGGQFIQNWQTPKRAGSCYKVTMTTDDGSSLSAWFILK